MPRRIRSPGRPASTAGRRGGGLAGAWSILRSRRGAAGHPSARGGGCLAPRRRNPAGSGSRAQRPPAPRAALPAPWREARIPQTTRPAPPCARGAGDIACAMPRSLPSSACAHGMGNRGGARPRPLQALPCARGAGSPARGDLCEVPLPPCARGAGTSHAPCRGHCQAPLAHAGATTPAVGAAHHPSPLPCARGGSGTRRCLRQALPAFARAGGQRAGCTDARRPSSACEHGTGNRGGARPRPLQALPCARGAGSPARGDLCEVPLPPCARGARWPRPRAASLAGPSPLRARGGIGYRQRGRVAGRGRAAAGSAHSP
jgi:hypothetical protein